MPLINVITVDTLKVAHDRANPGAEYVGLWLKQGQLASGERAASGPRRAACAPVVPPSSTQFFCSVYTMTSQFRMLYS
jgi:hypothetical protein